MKDPHWDHIDPDYPKTADRPYQLICGFTNEINLIERSCSINSSKSNRFLPWRVSYDEVGSVPVNPGDLCQFLDLDSGEWVLEEFMGRWWFEKTRKLCGEHKAGSTTFAQGIGLHAPGMASLGGTIGGKCPWWTNKESGEVVRSWVEPGHGWVNSRKVTWNPNKNYSSEELSEKCRRANQCIRPESLSKGGINASKLKYLCLVTGYVSNAPTVARRQKRLGIDKSFRISLKTVYFLVRSLYLIQRGAQRVAS